MKVGHWPAPSALSLPLSTGITALVVAGAAPLLGWALAEEQWMIAALLALAAAVPLVLRWPVIVTFGAYAFLVPFDFVSVLPAAGASLTRLVGLLAAAVLLGTGLVQRRFVRPPLPAVVWAVVMLWAILGVAWTVDSGQVVRGLAMLLSLFSLYLVAVSFRVSGKEFGWIFSLTVLGGMAASALTVIVGGANAYSSSSARTSVMIGEQGAGLNTFALSLILPLVLAMGSFMASRHVLGKAAAIVAVAVIAAAFFLTMSRGAIVGVAVSAAVLLYRFRVRWQVLVVAGLLLGVAAAMPEAFFDRMLAVGDKDGTGAGRTKIWAIGLEAIQHHGLIGSGLSTFGEVYTQTVALPPSKGGRAGHNTYLTAWVELGIVGLVLMVAAIALHLRDARRTGRLTHFAAAATRATEAACYGVLVSCFFGDYLWTKYFWLPWILLAWGLQQHESQGSQSTVAPSPPTLAARSRR